MKDRNLNVTGAPVMRRNVVLGLAVAAALASATTASHAANVTLLSSDPITTTSFNTGPRWSDGQAPSSLNDYFVPGTLTLRTPSDGGSIAFAGNSLTLGDNGTAVGMLTMKNLTNSIVTVNNLTMNKGTVLNGGNAAAAATTLTFISNAINLDVGGGTFDSGGLGRTINVNAPISGSGGLTLTGQGAITLLGTNTYTGPTTIAGGTTIMTDGASLPTASALNLNGGAIGTSGTFARSLGTAAGQVAINGSGGFSAIGGELVVALGGTAAPTPLTVGQNGFTPTFLVLNFSTSTNTVDFRNSVDLAGTTTFGVTSNSTGVANSAIFSGNITDSVGGGVFTKVGSGLVTLTGTNTHSGRTAVNGGILRGTEGVSLPSTTNISLNGGLLAVTGSTVTRSVGTGAGQLQWIANGIGGFAAINNDFTVALGGTEAPTPLVWGATDGFNPSVVILGGRIGTGTINFANAIDLSTTATTVTRTLTSLGGTAVFNGVISNTGAAQGTLGLEGDGTALGGLIILNGANTYGGITQIDTGTAGSATVRITNGQAFGTSLVKFNPPGAESTARLELTNNISVANNITLSGRANTSVAIQNLSGDNTLSGTVAFATGGGNYIIQSDTGTLTLSGTNGSTPGTAVTSTATNARTLTLQGAGNGVVSGVIANGSATMQVTKAGGGTWTLSGNNTYTGVTTVSAGTLKTGGGATTNVLSNAGGVILAAENATLELDYTVGSSPIAQVRSILSGGYANQFASGQIKAAAALPATRVLGYSDNGLGQITVKQTIPGDATLNGVVDFNDFLVLQNSFGNADTTFGQGNFNFDGSTDFNDFLVLQNNFGTSLTGNPVAVTSAQVAAMTAFAATVPEPAALGMLFVGAAALGARRQRKAPVLRQN